MHDSIIFSSGFLAPYRNALTLSSLWKLIANFISSKILVDEVIHYQASRHLNLIILSIKHKFTATTVMNEKIKEDFFKSARVYILRSFWKLCVF